MIIPNYRSHLNTDPNWTDFGSLNNGSLAGMILNMKDTKNTAHATYELMCNAWKDCIGYAIHPTAGVFFHSNHSYPLQYIRHWTFYIKISSETIAHQSTITQFTKLSI